MRSDTTTEALRIWDGEEGGLRRLEDDELVPRFTPVLQDVGIQVISVSPERFADSLEECDTLIVYGGYVTARQADFYGKGVDRVTVATLVFVIDVREAKLLHIEVISVWRPGEVTYEGMTTGRTKINEARLYVTDLLRSASDETQ